MAARRRPSRSAAPPRARPPSDELGARPLTRVGEPCPEDRDRALAALEAIAQLPAGVCGAFALHASGHTYREIAKRLAVSQRAVDRRLRRARERIRHLAET